MANNTPAGDAALNAQDKRLLTRDWVDSNSRISKHLRPSSSWDTPRAWTVSKTTAREMDDYHEDDYKNADGKRLLADGTIVPKGIGSEENHQENIDRLIEGQSYRRIDEKLDGSIFGDVDDIHAQGSIEGGDEQLGLAQDLFQTCLYIFRELWLELSELSPSPKCIRDGLLVEGLGKFYQWGDSFQDGTMDTTLAQSDELREEVLKLICQIGSILTRRLSPMVVASLRRSKLDDAIQHLTLLSERVNAIISSSTSEANSDSDDTDEERAAPSGRHKNEGTTGRDLRLLTGCLMELVPTLEQSLPRVGKLARSALLAPPPAFKVSGPAFTYVRNVYDKFPQADMRLTERLGEANWQRHVKVRIKIDQVANDELVESKAFIVAPFSEFRDSALGSSIPNQSHYAASAASHTSFVSSLADGEERSTRAPPTPAEVSAGKPFQCHICGQTLDRIRNRLDWKIHVFADLQPYICTFSTCKDALVKFPTRKMWVDHEFDEHRVNRSWVCPECPAESFSPDAWDEHLRQEHNITFEGSQHAIALDSARRIISKPIDEQQCPMCKAIPGSTRRAFSTHVGRHMEQIALVVLPRETDHDLEGSSVASDAPSHDQREGPRLGPDTALNLNNESGLLNKPERSVFEDSETGHLVNANGVIRDAGTASPFLTVFKLGSFQNPFDVTFNGPSRIWTDRSSSYRVEAKLLGLKDDRIVLRKLNEVKIAVPMVNMAIEDLRYVEQTTGVSLDWEKVVIRDPAGSLVGDAHRKLMQCDQCPTSFSKESEFGRHKTGHTKQFACERCYKRFSRTDMLRMHIVNGHCIPSDYENDLVGSDHSKDEEYIIKCICANEEDDGNIVLCEGCDTWQHIKCYYHSERVPEDHDCTQCVPRTIRFNRTVERKSVCVHEENRPRELGTKQDTPIDIALRVPLLIPHVTRPSTQAMNPPRIYNEPREKWKFDIGKDTKSKWPFMRATPPDPFMRDTPPSLSMRDTAYVHQSGSARRTDDHSRLDHTMSEVYKDELYDSELVSHSADQSAFVLGEPAYNPALKTATGIRKSRQADDNARVLAQHQNSDETVMPKVMTYDDALAHCAETESPRIPYQSPQLYIPFEDDPSLFTRSPETSVPAEPDFVLYEGPQQSISNVSELNLERPGAPAIPSDNLLKEVSKGALSSWARRFT